MMTRRMTVVLSDTNDSLTVFQLFSGRPDWPEGVTVKSWRLLRRGDLQWWWYPLFASGIVISIGVFYYCRQWPDGYSWAIVIISMVRRDEKDDTGEMAYSYEEVFMT